MTLTQALQNKGELLHCGGGAYLAETSKNTPTALNIKAYTKLLKNKSLERRTSQALQQAFHLLQQASDLSIQDKVYQIQKSVEQLTDQLQIEKRGLRSLDTVVTQWQDDLTCQINGVSSLNGIKTGLLGLDKLFGVKQLVRGSLMVIGARPKMGKTTLLIKILVNCALVQQKNIALFSLEMGSREVLEKILAAHSGVTSENFYPPNLTHSVLDKSIQLARTLSGYNTFFLDETAGINLSYIASQCRAIKRERGELSIIAIDYLTLMQAEKAERHDLSYGLITKGLKNLAKELNCIVILVTQLNRDLEKRQDKRPYPSDSRDTGQIEQDCDYWLGLYRESCYKTNADPNLTELLLRLNRHGKTGQTYLDLKHNAVYEISPQHLSQRLPTEHRFLRYQSHEF